MNCPDNYDAFVRHEAEQEKELNRLPRCCQCDHPIQQEDAVYINGEYICDECLEDLRVDVMGEIYD